MEGDPVCLNHLIGDRAVVTGDEDVHQTLQVLDDRDRMGRVRSALVVADDLVAAELAADGERLIAGVPLENGDQARHADPDRWIEARDAIRPARRLVLPLRLEHEVTAGLPEQRVAPLLSNWSRRFG